MKYLFLNNLRFFLVKLEYHQKNLRNATKDKQPNNMWQYLYSLFLLLTHSLSFNISKHRCIIPISKKKNLTPAKKL